MYTATITEIIKTLVPDAKDAQTLPGRRKRQVNVLASYMLTPGEHERVVRTLKKSLKQMAV